MNELLYILISTSTDVLTENSFKEKLEELVNSKVRPLKYGIYRSNKVIQGEKIIIQEYQSEINKYDTSKFSSSSLYNEYIELKKVHDPNPFLDRQIIIRNLLQDYLDNDKLTLAEHYLVNLSQMKPFTDKEQLDILFCILHIPHHIFSMPECFDNSTVNIGIMYRMIEDQDTIHRILNTYMFKKE